MLGRAPSNASSELLLVSGLFMTLYAVTMKRQMRMGDGLEEMDNRKNCDLF